MARKKTKPPRKSYQTPTAFAVRGVAPWYEAVKGVARHCGASNLNDFVDTLVREKARAEKYPGDIPARVIPPSPRKTLGD